ncbi:MAG: SUMF1/EgtB/PvdO family nonheme iron enzyme, partial [Chloroflexi bacterium]|nr:SUMF1/EgtB/PvdO family nonheme iron enzyme [Chloroflexota bacterium]
MKTRHFLRLMAFLFPVVLAAAAPVLAQTGTPPPVATDTLAPPTETPSLTPAPTATLTLPEYVAVHGLDERVLRELGLVIFLVAVGAVAVFGWLAAPYLKRWNERREQAVAKQVDRVADGDPMDTATREYLDRFEKKYSQFSFRGLEDVSGAKIPEFNTAYISLRLAERPDKEMARAGRKAAEPGELREGGPLEIDVSQAVKRSARLTIVGAAGSGKSTLLQWAGVSVARARFRRGSGLTETQREWLSALGNQNLLPIFIALRDYVRFCRDPRSPRAISPATLVEFIGVFYAGLFTSVDFPPDFFKQHLRRGCLLLLDGVDEVSPEQRAQVREAVEGLVVDYGLAHNYYLITSRSMAYRGAVEFAEFEQLEVQPLNRAQRDDLLRYWCDAIYPADEAARYAADLSASIEHSDDRVRQLARTPLMVSIFVLVYYHNRRRLPNQRAEFYYRATRVLVSETHKANAPDYPEWERLSVETRIDHLKRAAYELYTRNAQSATADELADWLKDESGFEGEKESAKEFLAAAANRSGLLEERGGQYGFFTHKTFHEFLAGLYVAQNKRKEWPGLLAKRAPDDQWQEVILLAAGSLAYLNAEDANDFVELLGRLGADDRDLLRLAGLERAALAQADFPHDRAQKHRKVLISRLETLMVEAQLNPAQRRPLGLALAALGDPRFTSLQPEFVKVEGGAFLMGTNDDEAERLKAQEADSWDDEKPQHHVDVSEFAIGKYLVTNVEFRRFVDDKGYDTETYWPGDSWKWRTGTLEPNLSIYEDEKLRKQVEDWLKGRPKEKRHQPFYWDDPQWNADNLPVVGVTWYEADAYCRWLTAKLRAAGLVTSAQTVHLPTEAQWEKAARTPPPAPPLAKNTPGEGRLWPWGDEWEANKCNSSESNFSGTTPVGMYPNGASGCGALDMVGNVWEWCADWWDSDLYSKRVG